MKQQKHRETKKQQTQRQSQNGNRPLGEPITSASIQTINPTQNPDAKNGDQPHTQKGRYRRQKQQEVPKPYRKLELFRASLTLIFNFCLVLITGVYTYYSHNQVVAMQVALEETRISREVENRAYLNVKAPALEKELTVGEQARATVTFANTGNTPAKDMIVQLKMELRDASAPEPDPKTLIPIANPQSKGVIPRDTNVVAGVASDKVLDAQIIDQISSEKMRLYVWGLAEYRDAFGKLQRTGFCGVVRPGTRALNMCARGNFAD
jgi:hypothetical protein